MKTYGRTHALAVALLVALSTGLGGCAYFGSLSSSQRMAYSTPLEEVPFPGEGEALVYFIRRGSLEHGWALLAVIYDGDDFAGFVPSNKMLPYYATSGKHLFMVYADAAGAKPVARFIRADLLEGEIYCVIVTPSVLSLSGGFEFIPQSPYHLFFEDYFDWMRDAQLVDNSTNAYTWAEQNRQQVLKTKARCLKKWNKRPTGDQPFLKPNYNIPYPSQEE